MSCIRALYGHKLTLNEVESLPLIGFLGRFRAKVCGVGGHTLQFDTSWTDRGQLALHLALAIVPHALACSPKYVRCSEREEARVGEQKAETTSILYYRDTYG